MKIEIGTAYYPEDWDCNRIEYDASLMRKVGIRYVRIAEFAWSHLEPTEGTFEFKWLHDAVDIFGRNGIKTVMCTPSSAAPAWMCRKYPEILRMKRNGDKAWFGVRDHTCYTSKKYRVFVLRMAEKMAGEFKNDPNLFAWQIDNEAGCSRFQECFCPDCQNAFREYLKGKYGTLENLNQCWGTTFWSGEYSDWNEIELEGPNENMGACRTLASYEFRNLMQSSFIIMQADAIRKIMPSILIGTNNYCGYDRYEVFSKLDFAGEDFYPSNEIKPAAAVFHTDLYRGLISGVPPWMLETPPAPGAPLNDRMRFYFWLFVGHGYDKIFYFLWTNHLAGNEKTHRTIMTQDGHPGLKYTMLRQLISEADAVLAKYPVLPLPQPKTALIYDYHASWIYTMSFISETTIFHELQSRTHEALFRTGYPPEIISSDRDFSSYSLVVFPIQAHVSKNLASRLEKYVADGGTILINGRSGMYDEYSKNLPECGPEHLKKLLGLEITDGFEFAPQGTPPTIPGSYEPTPEFERKHVIVTGAPGDRETVGTIEHWAGGVSLTTAESIMTYKNSIFKGYPFLTVNKFGKGHALYYASDITDQVLLSVMVRYAESLAGLPETKIPEGVDISRRGNLLFVSNFNDFELSFEAEAEGENIVGHALSNGKITLGSHATAVIELL